MKDLIYTLRWLNPSDGKLEEAANALERLTAGGVDIPAPCHHEMDGKSCVGYFSVAQLKDYGDQRAAAAVLAEHDRIIGIVNEMNARSSAKGKP